MTWLPSVSGLAIDLVDPTPAQVNFRDMAHTLANLNRYGGHGFQQVSVALHLLIGLDLCPEPVKPYWLLHDGHEERLGEITTPSRQALVAVARELGGDAGGALVKDAIDEFKRRHDAVIHAAAGLPMPSTLIRAQIAEIDLRCLATEHRDFHTASQRPWAHEALGIQPARSVRRWQSPDKLADQLYARFELHLPALRGGGTASLFEGN
jgi:uncharacterized protein